MKAGKRDLWTAALFFLCCLFFLWNNQSLYMPKAQREGYGRRLFEMYGERVPMREKDRSLKKLIAEREKLYNDHLFERLGFAERYGGLQRALGKRMLDDPKEDMRVYRGEGERLFYAIPRRIKAAKLEEMADSIAAFAGRLEEEGVDFVMVSAPNRNELLCSYLPKGTADFSRENREGFLSELAKRGVETLDLQERFAGAEGDSVFYRTDTHWRNAFALEAAEILAESFPRTLLPQGRKEMYYRERFYPALYIGSMGKRSGKYFFDGKDDYTLLLPDEMTSYYYMKTEDPDEREWEKRGSFEEVFLREEVLDSEDEYIDRYTAMMGYGTALEYIRNENLSRGKVLMIKDSFGMPLAAYLSTQVHELYLVDLRNAKMKERLWALIGEKRPEQVIFLYSPTSLYYFDEMFDLPS
ncbi:MAG: hypothetical protein Q4A78_07235 [Peptostreptococcaceae bacterium]|nr:hypothetical protein [Peptostreptococcaceae bacterium]